jgi:hypothetical protein
MSDNEIRWKWNEFVETRNNIHKVNGKELKTRLAKYALFLSDELLYARFLRRLCKEKQSIYIVRLPGNM